MRDTSAAARAALYAPSTGEVFLHLVTIDHDDLVAPKRYVDNLTDIVSRGETYTAAPIRITLPADVPDELASLDQTVDAVDRDLITAIRSIATPPTETIEVIMASSPDTIEAGPFTFDITSADYNAAEVRLKLEVERFFTEPYPVELFTPTLYPLLFQGVAR